MQGSIAVHLTKTGARGGGGVGGVELWTKKETYRSWFIKDADDVGIGGVGGHPGSSSESPIVAGGTDIRSRRL